MSYAGGQRQTYSPMWHITWLFFDLDGDGMINALDYDSDNDDLSDGIETGVEELVVSVGSEDSEGRTRSSLVKIGPRSTAAIALTIKGLDATDNRNQVQDTDDDSLADSTEKDPEDWILKFIQENPGLAYEVLNELQFIIKEESIQESIRNYNPIIYNEMEPVFYQVKAEIHMTCIQGAKTQLSALVKTTANYDDNWVRISGKVFHPLGIQAVAVGLSENSLTRAKLYTKTPDPRYDSAPMIAVFCSENLDVLSDVGFNAFRLNNYDIYLEAQSSDGAALKTKTIEMKTLVDSEDSIYRIGLDQKTFSNLASKIPPLQFMHDLGTTLSLFTCGASDTYDWSKFAKNIEDEGRADPYLQVGKSWGSHFFVGASLRRAGCSYDLTMRFSFIYERGMKADTLKKTLGRIGTVLVTPEDVELQDKADHNAVMWGWVAAYVYGSSVSARDTAIRATLQRKLVHNENAYEGELEGEHYQIGSTKLPTWFWFVEEDPVYFEYGNTPRPEDEPDMDDIEDSWKWNRKEVKTPTDSLSDFKDYIGKGGPFHYDKIYRESNGSFVPLFVDGVPP